MVWGTSLRDLQETLALSLGEVLSLAPCNRLVSRVAEPLEGCKTHALESPPPILLVDGMWVKIAYPTGDCRLEAQGRRRAGKRKQKRVVLRALGVWPDGHWELVVSDGANGLESALDYHLYGVARQRCIFHKTKQLADHVVFGELKVESSGDAAQATRKAKRQRKNAVLVEASWVYDGASAPHMRERAEVCQQVWAERAPDAVANFLVDFDKTLASLSSAFPEPFRGLIRTTNLLERFQQERRRKQRDIEMLQSEQGCETLWYLLSRRETAKQRAMLQSRL